ncbi:hypothetical protein CC78DRAFT_573189 [Lojkania enalia]|uniref:Uncharacterized protein n=1 Tax=Lojkania enalia TaxID=147567 RepID=A0A9P4TRP1_9PLEO|nr:hypothetical protein CC78DRAFT_573189 [Didymosphaeria enalia]
MASAGDASAKAVDHSLPSPLSTASPGTQLRASSGLWSFSQGAHIAAHLNFDHRRSSQLAGQSASLPKLGPTPEKPTATHVAERELACPAPVNCICLRLLLAIVLQRRSHSRPPWLEAVARGKGDVSRLAPTHNNTSRWVVTRANCALPRAQTTLRQLLSEGIQRGMTGLHLAELSAGALQHFSSHPARLAPRRAARTHPPPTSPSPSLSSSPPGRDRGRLPTVSGGLNCALVADTRARRGSRIDVLGPAIAQQSVAHQRQQQAAEFYRAQHNYSRASSSSGSAAHSLRRTPNFDDPRRRARPTSIDSAQLAPQHQRNVRFADHAQLNDPSTRPPRAGHLSRDPELFAPHPALRISRRTASAIRFVLEEAIRTPYPFTPDLAEENASMSDLTGGGTGRAANGGARTTTGPVPVPPTDRSGIRTPQMIMNQRREREARRQTEADAARAAEQQRKAEEEQRRQSAERRVQAAGVAGALATTDAGNQRQAQNPPSRPGDTSYATYPPTGGGTARQLERVVPASAGPGNQPIPSQILDPSSTQYGRPRATSQSQQHPRTAPAYQPAPASTSESRRPPPTQHSRHPSAPTGPSQSRPGPGVAPPPPPPPTQPAAAGPSGPQPRQSTTSTFPHAFERWETLSSHWEGLTSYWIRRLEQNTDEIRRDTLSQQMSRQITDLSAAGANLFHAVVELQRLRASSERKFQRWFYEHRQEQERAQEREAQLEHALRVEREARADAVANMERMATEKKNAERAVVEMKRELQISKEEARRAWEELGRREQEERDRTFALREGQPTLVGGVQVVPMPQGLGRHGSVPHRPHTGDDVYGTGPSSSHELEQHYSYEEGQSPTDTDPYVQGSRQTTALRHEPDVPTLSQGTYVPTGAFSAAAVAGLSQTSGQSGMPAPLNPQHRAADTQQSSAQTTTSRPEAFYQQPEAYLHRDTAASVATSIPEDERSYVGTSHDDVTTEGDEEYALDDYGNYILDQHGRRVPFRELRQRDSDEYNVEEDRRRELEHLQHYGTAVAGPSSYVTTSSAGPGYQQSPDYSGEGYGNEWTGMRHHHPTRLSDVPEEDEKSRTSPSRASQASRGIF